jgi:Fe-S-cluster containining protein
LTDDYSGQGNAVKECNQCGKCCINYGSGGLSATVSEIDQWETYRPDIARFVRDGEIWFSPETGKQLARCPWLQKSPGQGKYVCSIYYDRPDDCKYYPVDIEQMIRDECEMLEPRDLLRPKQAQRALDKLMVDSRPAASREY